VLELPIGGTAVGTGVNSHPRFGRLVAAGLSKRFGVRFREAEDHFEAQGTMDACVELSGALKVVAVSLLKITNDLRWMNSGPNAGLGEITLTPLQPGSSIMPGKVNPVIEESTAMVCAQVIGYDTAIAVGGMSGSFELNVMMPMIGHSLLESIRLLANATRNLADRSVSGISVRRERVGMLVGRNPVLVTALNPLVGYDLAAKIAKRAQSEGRPLRDVALEMADLSEKQIDRALNPERLTRGGIIRK
jgi:fumarate hydratase class II